MLKAVLSACIFLGSHGMNRLVRHQMSFGGGHILSDYFMNTAVQEEVYKQLEQDIVRDLLGDHMGRLP